ncbi:hypothetical protein PVAP13_6KG172206 [Panicum virgatum]|uniref:Uncharacterized protein n=1 Tax=Panicum virgatum TaxID=38727 RepID=A0A8T0RCC6_PANVG|nr:hypothetical protein PVAP13_6KG172206 [Panicum virgatum]
MVRRSIPLDVVSSLPRNLHAHHLCCLLYQQLAALLRAHPKEGPVMVMAFCPCHGWSTYACRDASRSSPEYTLATPPNSPISATPPDFLFRGTISARRRAPPFYMAAGSSSSMALVTLPGFTEPELAYPPPPPLASWTPGRPTATAVANARPSLCCIIKTGHFLTEMSGNGVARRLPSSGEGEL